jgi:prolyl-tRNA editing enzyme YbaK/EbsC (Cys-tRNA(Pro) deacylase)
MSKVESIESCWAKVAGDKAHCDARLGESETINFNAGDHCISVSMRYADYVAIEKPELGDFAD